VPRVIIVDDSADLRTLTRLTIELEGAAQIVGEARDALEALDLIDHAQPDVAIIDLHLPGISGVELIRFLHQRRTNLRLIAYSSDDLALKEAASVGAHAAVLKTGFAKELLAALSS
jgi:DNA-binding NarL/FixJ family response regulator